MFKALDPILDLVRRPKPATAAEIREALAGIDIPAAEREVDALETERQQLLLTTGSDADVDALEVRIKTANRNVERVATAERELKRLLGEAEQREAVAAVEQRAADGRAAREALINLYSDADSHAAALADILAKIGAARQTIRESNRITLEAGRRDLKVSDPIGELAQLVGAATADSLPNPMGWSLSGYWPLRDGAGNRLGGGRPLARIRELAAAQERPRKAA